MATSAAGEEGAAAQAKSPPGPPRAHDPVPGRPAWIPCANPGNPVFSCMLDAKGVTSGNLLAPPRLLLYKTTSGEYGALPPTWPTAPCRFFPRDNAFTTHALACGPMRYNCINTGLDRPRGGDPSDLSNTL